MAKKATSQAGKSQKAVSQNEKKTEEDLMLEVSNESEQVDETSSECYCPFGEKVGWFGCKTFLDEKEYKGKIFNISGYPGERGGREQLKMSGVGECQGPLLKYDIDTTGGQSGSPVWIVKDNKYYVIGVHTMGNPSLGNFATRIDLDFMRDILEMIKDFS